MSRGVGRVLVFVTQVVLLFSTHALIFGFTNGSELCEVTDVQVAADEEASTFIFNLTYRNRSCLSKDQLYGRLISCEGKKQSFALSLESEGQVTECQEPGAWKVTVEQPKDNGSVGHVESECFSASGLVWSPNITLSFTYEELKIHVINPDHRVTNWELTTYELKGGNFKCNMKSYMKQITDLFQKKRNFVTQSFINATHIQLAQDFDPDSCYCFVMEPIASVKLLRAFFLVSTKTCRPTSVLPAHGVEVIETNKTAGMTVGAVVVVMVILTVVVVIAVTLKKPKLLSSLLALQLIPAEGEKKPSLRKLLSRDVLLLYAPDVLDSEQLASLKNYLQLFFKVHDIFESNDIERLADPLGWLQKMLLKRSGVKLLLVESVGLQERMSTLLSSSAESNIEVTRKLTEMPPVARNVYNLLTFALRHILCTTLREDYSRVFVVRLADHQEQSFIQAENGVDLVVKMKRYNLPSHSQMLKEDMLQ